MQALVLGTSWGLAGGPRNSALHTGQLAVIGEGCLGFDHGSEQHAVVFPYGTTALPDGGGVVTPEGLGVRIGDEITGGGGGRSLEPGNDWVVETWPAAASTCGSVDATAGIDDITLADAG